MTGSSYSPSCLDATGQHVSHVCNEERFLAGSLVGVLFGLVLAVGDAVMDARGAFTLPLLGLQTVALFLGWRYHRHARRWARRERAS